MDNVESMSAAGWLLPANLPPSLLKILALLLVLSFGILTRSKKQKYAAAPIACVSGTTLSAARERFRKNAREMLREGYKQACPLPTPSVARR